MLRKSFKWIAVCCVFVLMFCFLIIVGVSGVLYNFFLDRSSVIQFGNLRETSSVVANVEGVVDERNSEGRVNEVTDDTVTSAKVCYASGSDVYIRSDDGLKLHARLIMNNPSYPYVIVCHGYMRQASLMSVYAYNFYKMGFNVLVPDARAHGESEGTIIGMGWLDRLDVCQWVDYIIEKDPLASIALHGVSMGGATVMMTAGEPLPRNVKAIVEDCGYTSAWDEFAVQSKEIMSLPEFPFLYVSSYITSVKGGYDFKSASAVSQVKKSVTPILFIHGDADDFVPFEMVWSVYEAATCEKELLIVPGAGHGVSFSTNPELYWGGIRDFLGKYIAFYEH